MKNYLGCNKFYIENIGFYGVMIFIILSVLYILSFPNMGRRFDSEECITLKDQWHYVDEQGVETMVNLPINLKANIENGIRISKILPLESDSKVGTIGMYAAFQYITAYLDGEEIYSYSPQTRKVPNYGKVDGSSWHVMRLPANWNGKELVLEITSPYKEYQGCLNNIFLGTKASFLFKIIELYGRNVLLSVGIIISGLLLLLIYVFICKLLKGDRGIFYLGWFQVWVGLWVFSQSSMAQFFFSNERIVEMFSFVSLMILPIPLLLYIYNRKNIRFKKVLHFQVWVHAIEIVVVTLLQFMNIQDYYETLVYTHIILMISILMIAGISFYEKVICKNDDVNLILFCAIVLGGSGVLELIYFYMVNRFRLGDIFNLGITVCIIASVLKAVQQTYSVLKLSGEAQYYERLATLDYMTGCQNRTAYLRELQSKNQTLNRNDEIAVVVSDLNHLKLINDEMGHNVGDSAIRLCALMLNDNLGEIGTCYRIGGDEFVCLIYNQKEAIIKEKIENIMVFCEKESKEWKRDFAIAIGYSFYNSNIDRELESVVQRADEKMYEVKHKMKMN